VRLIARIRLKPVEDYRGGAAFFDELRRQGFVLIRVHNAWDVHADLNSPLATVREMA
jgi:hypothetical protein